MREALGEAADGADLRRRKLRVNGIVEADEADVFGYALAGGNERPQRAHGCVVAMGEDAVDGVARGEEVGHELFRLDDARLLTRDKQLVVAAQRHSVRGERPLVAHLALVAGVVGGKTRDAQDVLAAALDEVLGRHVAAADVVGAHVWETEVVFGRTVDADHGDSVGDELAVEPAQAGDADDTVGLLACQRAEVVTLAGGVIGAVADKDRVVLGCQLALHMQGDLGKEVVGDVRHDHADGPGLGHTEALRRHVRDVAVFL